MSSYPVNKIKIKRSYSINEMASLLDIGRKTCGRWIRCEGLKVIEENTNPLLVMGLDLKEFIKEKQAKRKVPLKENEFFCFKCHKAVIPKIGSEKTIKTGKRIGIGNQKQLKKIGACELCGTEINKYLRVSQKD
jgi:hypothetical protein